jgi:purine-binding chemotaxis protein CheW
MNETPGFELKVAELRRAFDLSFALPPPQASPAVEDLLTIRVSGDPYAIRLCEIAEIVAKRKIVPLPAGAPDFLGLAGIGGGIVPVFGLASILGYAEPTDPPPWLVLCGAEEPIALAFSDFEGYLRLPKSALHADENLGAARHYVEEVASTDAGVRPVISIRLAVETIRNRTGPHRPAKEQ